MRTSILATALALSATALGACGDMTSSVGPATPAAQPGAVVSPPNDPASSLAHAFALALARADVRIQIRDAMRSSRVTEHKLVLRDFVATPAGRLLIAAAAQATGTTREALLAEVHALPPMDFFAPYREHRLRWRATDDVWVGGTLDPAQPALALYASDGVTRELRQNASAPSGAVFLLLPSERKSPRIDAQPDGPGLVIQDASDGELSGTVEWVDASGRARTVPLTRLQPRRRGGPSLSVGDGGCGSIDVDTPCMDEGAGGTGTVPNFTDTYLAAYSTTVGDGFTLSSELDFRASYHQGGVVLERRTVHVEGVATNHIYTPYYLTLLTRHLPDQSSDYIRINVVETDWLDDDDKGSRNFYFTDRNAFRSIVDNGSLVQAQAVTDIRLGWLDP